MPGFFFFSVVWPAGSRTRHLCENPEEESEEAEEQVRFLALILYKISLGMWLFKSIRIK